MYGSLSRQEAPSRGQSLGNRDSEIDMPAPSTEMLNDVNNTSANSAPIPKGPRMLRDDQDKLSMQAQRT